MRTYTKYIGLLAVSAMTGAGLMSCQSESPFDTDGEGVLRMNVAINSSLTRAGEDNEEMDLASECVLYLSNEKGLIYKYKGLQNVPEALTLKTGHYVAEAWTGDSVPASFTSRFYRGYEPFDLAKGQNNVVINCRIANVVVSVNNATVDNTLMQDWSITVSNDGSSLTFDKDNVATSKAYYMMSSRNSDLEYEIKGLTADGKAFSKTGTLADVERAHEYILNLTYNPSYEQEGGAYVTVSIDDTEIDVSEETVIYGAPSVRGADFDITRQVYAEPGEFLSSAIVKVSAFNGIKSLILSGDDLTQFGLPAGGIDLMHATETSVTTANNAGLTWDYESSGNGIYTSYIHMSEAMLNALPARDTEYRIDILATDVQNKMTETTLRLAVGENAIVLEDPVTVEDPTLSDFTAVRSNRATLTAVLADTESVSPRIEYRAEGESAWLSVPIEMTRAAGIPVSVTLSGLKPGTRYEYRAACEGWQGESLYLTTEPQFVIPNSSMEDWSSNLDNLSDGKSSSALVPSADGHRTFWDSGNHGSATMGVTLTQSDETMFNSGSRSARLRSQFVGVGVLGKFAAGNLFAGTYLKTDGTDGCLQFGRPYDGSHPDGLELYMNYRPGVADSKGANSAYVPQGSKDEAQIFIALATEPFEVLTKKAERLFDKDDPTILAYGERTFSSDFGADGTLEKVSIPLTYYERAKTAKPLYLIIVCSASKYGDYFCGGEGSVMYVDDFRLVYE